MLVNSSLTVYHKDFDEKKRVERWIKHNYGTNEEPTVWWHGGKGVSVNKGYENANDVQIRIFYDINPNLDIKNFERGDILVQGTLDFDIKSQQDLRGYEIYNITSISNNIFGSNKHIHLGGK